MQRNTLVIGLAIAVGLVACYPDSGESVFGGDAGARDTGTSTGDVSGGERDTGREPETASSDTEDTGPIVLVDTTPEPTDTWPADWVAMEDQVLVLVNQRRAAGATCGRDRFGAAGPLVMNAELRAAARLHGEDMAERGYFDHVAPDGSDPFDRIAAAGYRGGYPQGENIAAGYPDAAAVVAGWMTSPGHCSNIMEPGFGAIGIGVVFDETSRDSPFWVQNFGGRP